MKAIILVGGEGTRLRPLTYTTVKAMMPVLNKPFIWHVLNHLAKYNIHDIILAMGYKPDTISNYFESIKLDSNVIYSLEKDKRGTAGAVKNAQPYITQNETLFVLNGDIMTDLDFTSMLRFHRQNKAKVTIALTRVEDPSQFGVVELTMQNRITRFIEKPKREEAPTNLINAGTYIIESEILERIPDNTHYMFERNVFPQLVADGIPVYGFVSDAYWIDMGTPSKYLSLNGDILNGKCHLIEFQPNNKLIDETVAIDPSAHLTGAIIIDKGCIIGKDVQLVGPLSIGANCRIMDNCKVEKSIIWDNVTINQGAEIIDSIIANNNIIEAHARLDNNVIGTETISN